MALVSQSVISRWYQTNSWVYKNFAYLFQNPLWHKNIPRGFSVCPYFWLNLFSLIIFRPFIVWPCQYVLRPLLNLLGAPAKALDRVLFRFYKQIGLVRGDYFFSFGILLSLAFLALALLCGGSVFVLVAKTIASYPYIKTSSLALFSFWSAMSFLGLFLGLVIHKVTTKTECKTMAYLWVWLGLFLVASVIFIPSEVGHLFMIIGQALAQVGLAGLGLIWGVICFLAKWIWVGITYAPIETLRIPWWAYAIPITLIGWIALKLGEFYESKQNFQFKTETTAEFWERNKSAWLGLFSRIIGTSDYWSEGQVFRGDQSKPYWSVGMFDTDIENKAVYAHRHTVYRKALELHFHDQLEVLKKSYPLIKCDVWQEFINTRLVNGQFADINEILDDVVAPTLDFDKSSFRSSIAAAVKTPEIAKLIADEMAYITESEKKEAAKIEARKNSASAVMCKRVTTAINEFVRKLFKYIKAFGIQAGTFLVYLWTLIKAKKQGACPYLQFTNPTDISQDK